MVNILPKYKKPDFFFAHFPFFFFLCDRFNPDYAKYGFSSWPGGLAHNAFNNSEVEPYTGRLDINDYIDDLQVPQMLDIALKYDTEIMVSSSDIETKKNFIF
jgi:alpha-L-fucosidase